MFLPLPETDEKRIRDAAVRFGDQHLRPHAIEDDENAHFRREAFNEMAKEKLTCLVVPEEFGGQGLSHLCYYGCLEEVARASGAMAVTAGVTNLVQGALTQFGTADQKEKYLKRLVTGEYLGAFSLSESASGSDAASLKTAARRVPGGYRITGTKMWCSTAGHADLYLLMARTAEDRTKGISSFLISRDTPGFRIGKMEKKLGLSASSLAELIFEDCFVPEDRRLGDEGQGLAVALSQLDGGRITIGAAGVGLAIEAIERVWRYYEEVRGEMPENVRYAAAYGYAECQAVRLLIRVAALEKDARRSITAIAAQAKLMGSDLAMRVTSQAIEWMGEAGYRREHEIERLFRDAKALQIVEGTNQIQRLVITREMERML